MNIFDLSEKDEVALQIGVGIYLITPEIKNALVDFLDEIDCPLFEEHTIPHRNLIYVKSYNNGRFMCEVSRDHLTMEKVYRLVSERERKEIYVTTDIEERDRFVRNHNWIPDPEWR